MIVTRDVGDYDAQRLVDVDVSGKQTRELLGERDRRRHKPNSWLPSILNT